MPHHNSPEWRDWDHEQWLRDQRPYQSMNDAEALKQMALEHAQERIARMSEELRHAYNNNATVHAMMRAGASYESIIAALCRQINDLILNRPAPTILIKPSDIPPPAKP